MQQKQKPVLLCIPRVLDSVTTHCILPLFQKLDNVLWVRCKQGDGFKSVYISLFWGESPAALLARQRVDAGLDFKVMYGSGDQVFPWFWKVYKK